MIDLVKKFFSRGEKNDSEDRAGESQHSIRVASCALFLEMCNIDGEFNEAEKEKILSVLKKDHDLSDEEAEALIEAADDELKRSIDLWRFTHLINQNYTAGEKVRIIETVWEIAYKDGRLDKHEEYLARKLTTLLRLSHKQLIDAKLKVKQAAW